MRGRRGKWAEGAGKCNFFACVAFFGCGFFWGGGQKKSRFCFGRRKSRRGIECRGDGADAGMVCLFGRKSSDQADCGNGKNTKNKKDAFGVSDVGKKGRAKAFGARSKERAEKIKQPREAKGGTT